MRLAARPHLAQESDLSSEYSPAHGLNERSSTEQRYGYIFFLGLFNDLVIFDPVGYRVQRAVGVRRVDECVNDIGHVFRKFAARVGRNREQDPQPNVVGAL